MLDDESAKPHIAIALARLGVPFERWDGLAQSILTASFIASFQYTPPGKQLKPAQILAAVRNIEAGLQQAQKGLRILDAARATAGPTDTERSKALMDAQQSILIALAQSVCALVKGVEVTPEQLAASMPRYGFASFENDWSNVFRQAIARTGKARESLTAANLRLPTRAREEGFLRGIGMLGDIYEEATGDPPKAYSKGSDSRNPDWKPPFVRFVEDLWPLFRARVEAPPSGSRLEQALTYARNLPPLGTLK